MIQWISNQFVLFGAVVWVIVGIALCLIFWWWHETSNENTESKRQYKTTRGASSPASRQAQASAKSRQAGGSQGSRGGNGSGNGILADAGILVQGLGGAIGSIVKSIGGAGHDLLTGTGNLVGKGAGGLLEGSGKGGGALTEGAGKGAGALAQGLGGLFEGSGKGGGALAQGLDRPLVSIGNGLGRAAKAVRKEVVTDAQWAWGVYQGRKAMDNETYTMSFDDQSQQHQQTNVFETGSDEEAQKIVDICDIANVRAERHGCDVVIHPDDLEKALKVLEQVEGFTVGEPSDTQEPQEIVDSTVTESAPRKRWRGLPIEQSPEQTTSQHPPYEQWMNLPQQAPPTGV